MRFWDRVRDFLDLDNRSAESRQRETSLTMQGQFIDADFERIDRNSATAQFARDDERRRSENDIADRQRGTTKSAAIVKTSAGEKMNSASETRRNASAAMSKTVAIARSSSAATTSNGARKIKAAAMRTSGDVMTITDGITAVGAADGSVVPYHRDTLTSRRQGVIVSIHEGYRNRCPERRRRQNDRLSTPRCRRPARRRTSRNYRHGPPNVRRCHGLRRAKPTI